MRSVCTLCAQCICCMRVVCAVYAGVCALHACGDAVHALCWPYCMHCAHTPAPPAHAMPRSAASASSTPASDDWADFPDPLPPAHCLFCPATFDSPAPLYAHCRQDHAFDLPALRRRLRLGFYDSVRLINYIRDQVRRGCVPAPDLAPSSFADDAYLRPVLPDDRLLMDLQDDDSPPLDALPPSPRTHSLGGRALPRPG
ncbi:hypothetical protein PMAC_001723 [Pneumocystis sp. 'macacae']|nr:hypothetical protein PMAC_001723 [Pneumocystis sp. 'macacae']